MFLFASSTGKIYLFLALKLKRLVPLNDSNMARVNTVGHLKVNGA